MEPLTFEQLPQAVSLLHDKLNNIEQLLREGNNQPSPVDELLSISEAAKFLNLSVPTLYGKVSRKEVTCKQTRQAFIFL